MHFTINGQSHDIEVDVRTSLLDLCREHLGLTGSKKGCDHGQCGACTMLVNGRRVNSCLTLAVMHQDDEITTIEGGAQPGNPPPTREAPAPKAGYSQAELTVEEISERMSGNLCRCAAYPNIVDAIREVAGQGDRNPNEDVGREVAA